MKRILMWVAAIWCVPMLALAPQMIKAWRQRKLFEAALHAFAPALIRRDYARTYAETAVRGHDPRWAALARSKLVLR